MTKYLFIVVLFVSLFSCTPKQEKYISSTTISDKIQVGVFNGSGASPICVIETMEALKIDEGITPFEISAADIMNGRLDRTDVLIFPGGSGSKEFNNIGQLAAEKIKSFGQNKDKGIVGICAGGYLMASTPTYSNLDILQSPHTRDHYDRGRGLISFHLNEKGKDIFYELKNNDSLYIQYYDGPIFDNPKLTVLGDINTDIVTKKGYPHNFTQGKPAFFTKNYGEGKIFVSVGHPEATAGMRWMVPRMARYVSNKKLITYQKELIKPELNNKEILFFSDTKKRERQLFWDLTSDDISKILNALDELHNMRSRPSIRWSVGLLRHKDGEVRLKAANYLLQSEYTAAIKDVEAAVRFESDSIRKQQMQNILYRMKQMIDINLKTNDIP